jgi:hypothetical protein
VVCCATTTGLRPEPLRWKSSSSSFISFHRVGRFVKVDTTGPVIAYVENVENLHVCHRYYASSNLPREIQHHHRVREPSMNASAFAGRTKSVAQYRYSERPPGSPLESRITLGTRIIVGPRYSGTVGVKTALDT